MSLLTFVFSVPQYVLAAEYQATYSLYWHGVRAGTSIHTVRNIKNNTILAESVSKPILSLMPFYSHEKSQFSLRAQQIRPLLYEYQTQEKSKKQFGTIGFDWQKKSINKVKNKAPAEVLALPLNTYDKISVYFQLQEDLRAGKTALNYSVVEPEQTKTYQFSIAKQEMLQTAVGEYETIVVEHLSHNKERLTTLWLAKDLDYLIVKLEQKIKGKRTGYSTLKTLKTARYRPLEKDFDRES